MRNPRALKIELQEEATRIHHCFIVYLAKHTKLLGSSMAARTEAGWAHILVLFPSGLFAS